MLVEGCTEDRDTVEFLPMCPWSGTISVTDELLTVSRVG